MAAAGPPSRKMRQIDPTNDLKLTPLHSWLPESLSTNLRVESKENFKRIASYNYFLKESDFKSIIVPGVPPEFVDWKGGKMELAQEETREASGRNAMELCLRAVKDCWMAQEIAPHFQDFDFVCTKRSLNRLFRFCLANQARREKRAYRLDLERVGRVVLMDRSLDEPDRALKFVSSYMAQTTRRPTWRQFGRFCEVMSYNLGPLRLMVRAFADAAVFEQDAVHVGELADALTAVQITDNRDATHSVGLSEREDRQRRLAAQYKYETVDLQTAPIKFRNSEEDFSGRWPNLFFSDAKMHKTAYHTNGVCSVVDTQTREQLQQRCSVDVYAALSKMTKLLEEVLAIIRKEDAVHFSLVWEPNRGGRRLRLYERKQSEWNQSFIASKEMRKLFLESCYS